VPPSILRGGNSRRRAGVPLKRVDALEIQLGRQTSQPSPLQERDFLADGRLVPVGDQLVAQLATECVGRPISQTDAAADSLQDALCCDEQRFMP